MVSAQGEFGPYSATAFDGGGSSVYVLLSLVNKETALAFLIGQPLGGRNRQNKIVGERKQRQ